MTAEWTGIDADEAEVHLEDSLIEEVTSSESELVIALTSGIRIRVTALDAGKTDESAPVLAYEFRRGD